MAFTPINAEDATLLSSETAATPQTIGALCLLEGEPLRDAHGHLRVADIQRHVERRLDRIPRFRQRLVPIPLDLGPPVWADDPGFDIADHVLATRLAPPGSMDQLRRFVSDVLASPFDSHRPPWEIWLVDGLEDGRVAMIPKINHVIADGVALLDFAASVLDAVPEPDERPSTGWAPGRQPGHLELVGRTWLHRSRRWAELAGHAATSVLRPGDLIETGRALAGTIRSSFEPAPALPLTRPVGRRRDFVWFDLPLADLKDVAHAHGATLNDVVLAVVAGALRRYSDRVGAQLCRHDARGLVPVSTRPPGTVTENAFAVLTVDLPTSEEDPLERIRLAHEEMARRKGSAERRITTAVYAISDVVPFWLLRRLTPVVLQRQRFVNLGVTNLAGSADPLYLAGARLEEVFPFVGVTGNVGAIIGVLSYLGRLGVGITVDPDIVPDVDAFAADALRSTYDLLDRPLGELIDHNGDGLGAWSSAVGPR